jgi:hypothetical protein
MLPEEDAENDKRVIAHYYTFDTKEVGMAGKKPAKVNSGNNVKQDDRPGKATLYIATGRDTFHICPTCSKKTGKGIIYEHQNTLYCSRGCVAKASVVL